MTCEKFSGKINDYGHIYNESIYNWNDIEIQYRVICLFFPQRCNPYKST
jgi:hypothetical protein